MQKVAIVILNYNGKKYLELLLNNVLEHCPLNSVYIIDNASTDGSVAFLKEQYTSVPCLVLEQNLGFAGGYNEGLKQIDAEYFVLLNSDVELSANWLEPLLNYLEEHPNTVAVQPKIKAYHQKTHFEYAGASGGFIDLFGYPFCRGRLFDTCEEDVGQYQSVQSVFWATGACLCIRSKAYFEVGGIDEDFFAHMEEIDLCWRLKNRGYDLAVVPQSEVYHIGGGTLSSTSPFKTYLNYRNNLIMLLKNAPWTTLLWLIPMRLVLDGISSLKLFKDQGFQHFWAVGKAHLAFYRRIPKTLRKRQKNSQFLAYKEVYGFPLIIDYFVRKIKTFKGLGFME